MSIIIFHVMKKYWDFTISITQVQITNAMSTPSILTCEMTMIANLLIFLCLFFIILGLFKFISTYKTLSSMLNVSFIFIRNFYFLILLHSFFYVISCFTKVIAKHINGILSSIQKLLISITNSIHQVQHKFARFMFLIILGFNFITFMFFKLFS